MNWVPPNAFHFHQGHCCPPSCSPWPLSSWTPRLCPWPALNHLPKPDSDLTMSWESSTFYIALAGCHYLSTVSWQQVLDDHQSPTPTLPHMASYLPKAQLGSRLFPIRRPSPDPQMDLPCRLLGNSKFKDIVPRNSARFQWKSPL